jgi:hypothetical protein
MMLPSKLQFIWSTAFRGDDFLEINQSETKLPVAAMFDNRSKRNQQSLYRTFHRCCLSNFGSFGGAGSEQKIF